MNAGTYTWTGKMLGKYELGPLLGQGGMAQVYKSRHPTLKRDVAIKLIHSYLIDTDGFVERFQREAQLVAALRHPNIVQVHDFDAHTGVYYMVMEFIDGPTLGAQLEQKRSQNTLFPLPDVIDLFVALCNALDYAHAQGMVHRDVKPGNVMFTSKWQPVLTDFGLAKIVSGTNTSASGMVIGTPMYMSPEQANGESGDGRSDIYSLGVMLFEMVTGHIPFPGDTPLKIIFKQLNEPLPSAKMINPQLPDAIEQIIRKATEKKPQARYQTCADLAAALRSVQSTVVTPVTLVSGTPPILRPTPPPPPTPAPIPPKTIQLDGLRPIFMQVLGPVGRIMEVNRIVTAMHENPTAFPFSRLDELLDRISTYYHVTDKEKMNQIRQKAKSIFGNSR